MKKLVLLLMAGAFIWLAMPSLAAAECDVCGDLTGGREVDLLDITAFIDWYFSWPNPVMPNCPCGGDVNCDGAVNVNDLWDTKTDLGYLLTYMYKNAPDPCDPDDDGEPDCNPGG